MSTSRFSARNLLTALAVGVAVSNRSAEELASTVLPPGCIQGDELWEGAVRRALAALFRRLGSG